ncbi:MAG: hypothetical protein ACLUNQ_02485 [Oscillospiraceae bacterium]
MKRKLEPLLRGGLALLLCLVTILLAANIQAGQPRRQQQDPTSRMLLSDADILYDADGVSRFDGTDNQPTDQNEDTSQDQPPEERDDDLVSTPISRTMTRRRLPPTAPAARISAICWTSPAPAAAPAGRPRPGSREKRTVAPR